MVPFGSIVQAYHRNAVTAYHRERGIRGIGFLDTRARLIPVCFIPFLFIRSLSLIRELVVVFDLDFATRPQPANPARPVWCCCGGPSARKCGSMSEPRLPRCKRGGAGELHQAIWVRSSGLHIRNIGLGREGPLGPSCDLEIIQDARAHSQWALQLGLIHTTFII